MHFSNLFLQEWKSVSLGHWYIGVDGLDLPRGTSGNFAAASNIFLFNAHNL